MGEDKILCFSLIIVNTCRSDALGPFRSGVIETPCGKIYSGDTGWWKTNVDDIEIAKILGLHSPYGFSRTVRMLAGHPPAAILCQLFLPDWHSCFYRLYDEA